MNYFALQIQSDSDGCLWRIRVLIPSKIYPSDFCFKMCFSWGPRKGLIFLNRVILGQNTVTKYGCNSVGILPAESSPGTVCAVVIKGMTFIYSGKKTIFLGQLGVEQQKRTWDLSKNCQNLSKMLEIAAFWPKLQLSNQMRLQVCWDFTNIVRAVTQSDHSSSC